MRLPPVKGQAPKHPPHHCKKIRRKSAHTSPAVACTSPAGGSDKEAAAEGAADGKAEKAPALTREQMSKVRGMTLESYAGDMQVTAEG
jgi:hypothetical protein